MRRTLLLCALIFSFSAGVAAQSLRSPQGPPQTSPEKSALPHQPARPLAKSAATSPAALAAARASFAKLPLSFEENHGQTDGRVKFLSRGPGYNLFLTNDEAVIALRNGNLGKDASSKNPPEVADLWLKMLGANPSPKISSSDLLPGKINYYVGNDSSKWRTGVRQYGRVTYRGIYPGVDLTYYGNQQQLESDFVVAPGANPRSIEFEVAGAKETRLDAQGNLVLVTSAGDVQLLRPVVYQTINGVRHDVAGRYLLRGKDSGKYRVGFEIAKYDRRNTLVIDPTLVYSTYLGGSNVSAGDGAMAIAVDAAGHAYITGAGTSSDFPGPDMFGPPNSSLNNFAYVTELDATGSSGTALVYSTILAGSVANFSVSTAGNGIGVDTSGNAYVAGTTGSSNFPMVNPFQGTFGGASSSGFVAGLKSDGTLLYSTYFGGRNGPGSEDESDATILQGLFADPAGNAYVVGNTTSQNFPTVNPFQSTLNVSFPDEGQTNVIVAKFNPQGQPIYSTYLNGTNSDDVGNAIVADTAGNAYVTGETVSANFPIQSTPTPFQAAQNSGSADVFVTKLSFSGSALTLTGGTYLGGSGTDEGWGIAVDTATPPNVYVTGQTNSNGTGTNPFPTKNAIFAVNQGSSTTSLVDAFVTKISGDFTSLVYSTYLGGSGVDTGFDIALDHANPPNAYVTGSTTSPGFPTVSPLQSALGGATTSNAFVTEVNGAGNALAFSTFLGGNGGDAGHGIALDSTNNIYVAGQTASVNFPLMSGGTAGTSPFQGQLGNSKGNAFIAKISPAAPPVALTFFPASYNFHTVGLGGLTGFTTTQVTLTNNTGSVVAISGFTMGGTNPGDFTVQAASPAPCSSTTLPFNLAVGASCTLLLRFTPMDQDARSGTLSVNSNATASNVLNLSGNGGVPQVSLSTTSITFFPNPAPLNVQTIATVTVTNSGGGPLMVGSTQISASSPANAAPFSVVSGCPTTAINPGGSCSIELGFTPTTGGTFNASLLINTNAAGSPQTLAMTGVGVAEVIVTPTTPPLNLGIQAVNTTATNAQGDYEVINGSGVPITLTITSPPSDFHPGNTEFLTQCTTGLVLSPGTECGVVVTFLPTATGTRTAAFTVAYSGTAVSGVVPGSQVVNVTGVGVTGISLLTNSINMGNEFVGFTAGSPALEEFINGSNNPVAVTITNIGNNPGDFAAILDSTCAPSGVVPANTICNIGPTFTPSALGSRSATINFDYTGETNEPLQLSLTGTGIPGPVAITVNGTQTNIHDFGSEIVSTTTPETKFLVRNIATVPLTISSITAPGNADFAKTPDSTCTAGGIVPAGGNCFIGFTFTPSPGALTNPPSQEKTTVTITDAYAANVGANMSSPHTLMLSGTAEPAVITISVSTGGSTLLDFGNVPINPATANIPKADIFLTNAGGAATTITWPASGNAPALVTAGTAFSLNSSGINVTTCLQNKVVVAQGGSCQIAVQFDPTTAGLQTNSVTFTDSVGGSHTVNIQGTGVGQGLISLSTTMPATTFASLNFSALEGATSASQSVTVANLGSGPLTITGLPIFGGTNSTSFNILPSSTCALGTVLPSGSTGNTCVFNVTFTAPATAGSSNEDLEIQANLGNNQTSTAFIGLGGTSFAGGISLSPAGTIGFGTVAVGSTSNDNNTEFGLTNNFPTAVTLGTMSLPNGYMASFDDCSGQVLAPSGECFFELSFTPTSAVSFNGNLSISFTGTGVSGSPFMNPITGAGAAAVVASPNPASFQFVSVGNTSFVQVAIENGSASQAIVTAVNPFTGTNATNFSIPSGDNGCAGASGTLPGTNGTTPGGSCSIDVQFLTSTPGNFTAQFTVSYSVSGVAQTPITVVVNASIPAAQITITPNPLTFPSQSVNTQSQPLAVTITNSSSATQSLNINNLVISDSEFALAANNPISNCFNLAPGASCTILLTFTPSQASSTPGDRTGTLSVVYNNNASTQTVGLKGTGGAGSVFTETTNMSFPTTNVGSSATQTILLTNTTTNPVTLSTVAFTGPYSAGTGPNACVASKVVAAVNGTCVLYVTFTPTGGATSGTLVVKYNSDSVTLPTINLTGSQSNPIVSLTPNLLTFPTVLEGSSSTMSATLTNGTPSSITISSTPSIGAPGNAPGDFTFASDACTSGATISSGGGTCIMGIKFSPLGVGARSATLSVTDSEGTHTIALNGTGTTPATITSTSGGTQSVVVNSAFASLQATVKDANGIALSGVSVTFTVTAAGNGASGTFTGGVTSAQVTTDINGIATAPTFTANNVPGGAYTVAATAGAVGPANFSLTNLAGTPASITTSSGTPQSVAIGTAFASLQATVKDSNSLPLDGVVVTFTAPSTGASGQFANSTNTTTATTNTSGIATASTFTANAISGSPYNVTATAGAVGPANFSLTNLAGAPASVTATSGTPQSIAIGTLFPTALQATVKDSGGNLLSGVVVTFTAPSTGASGTFTGGGLTVQVMTNASGIATATAFTANSTVGPYTVNATVSGVGSPAAFSLTNLAGPPATITATTGTPQTVAISSAFPIALQATVKDSGGNLVSGATVTFTVAAAGNGASGTFTGGVTSTQVQTNGSGVATAPTFTSNTIPGGPYTVTAASGAATSAAFSLTNVAGPPAAITATAGTPQNTAVTTAFGTLLQATVKDSAGNLVSGATVTFTAPNTGASGTFANGTITTNATTNGSGIATASAFTANTIAGGPYNVTVTSGTATSATFSLTNNPGPAASVTATAGTPQNAAVTAAFTTAFQATVKDSQGNPVSGATVTFTAPSTGASGTFANATITTTAMTDGSGIATASAFTANTIAGGPYNVTATSGTATSATFSLTNNAGPAAVITATAGTPQTIAISTAFPTLMQATVKDSHGNLVSGASVTFTAPSTGASGTFANGTITTTANTNGSGIATATAFTANTTAGGPYNVVATSGSATSASFSLTNTAGPAAAITATGGATQSMAINTPFAALQATVKDSGGNPVSGATVTFTVAAAGNGASGTFTGALTSAQVMTNGSGVATAPTFTANTITGGPYTVTATSGTATSATFTLTNLTVPPASIAATAGTPQSIAISTAFPTALQVIVKDSGSNPIAGVAVTFTVTAAGNGASGTFTGNLTTAQATTNAAGVATAPTFTANTIAGGPYTVAATAGALPPANFSLTNLVGPASTITATSGASQNVTVNTSFATMQATVKDSGGNVVSGASVTFTVTAAANGASGTFTGNASSATVNTNTNGVAIAPAFTANAIAGGPYTVAAKAGTVGPANFTLTNNAGPAAVITATGGASQSVAVNTAFASMQVTVKDSLANPVSGATVTFTVTPAGSGASGTFTGGLTSAQVTTNASGMATAPTFTANNTVGGPYNVTATSGTATNAVFALTNLAGTPASVTATAGTPQSVAIGTAFAPMQATVKDNNGVGLASVVVTFTVTAATNGASGTFTGNMTSVTATTNGSGIATAPTFSANTISGGPYAVAATTGAVAPANFSLTNLAGAPASITATAGATQSIAISTAFPTAMQATVKDSGGNLLSGVIVTFTVTPAGNGASGTFTGNLTTVQATSNASGVATAPTFTANTIAGGPYTVAATAGTATAGNFSLTNLTGPAATITATAGATQSIVISTAFPTALQVTVKDSGGNLISGATVTFTAPATGASGTFVGGTSGGITITATTNASGIATAPAFTANGTSGAYSVNATVAGVTAPAVFSLTNLAGPPASITATAGTPQSAPVTTAFGTALQATVKDSGGNLVSGATVTFTAPGANASGTFTGGTNGGLTAVVTTNASGVATAPAFTANATGGAYSVTASVAGVTPTAAFLLTNTVAPDVTITKTHTGDFTVGSNGVYTIKVTNNGTGPTTGTVTVADTLPTGLTFVSGSTAGGWSCTAAGQLVTCANATVGVLAAKGGNSTVMITVSVGPNAVTSATIATVTNSAAVSDPGDTVTTDKSATDAPTNIDNAVPTQSSFTPNLGLIAGATSAQQIVITGTGFNSTTQVMFGTNPALTGTANATGTSLTINVPAADLANAGNVTVSVTNPKNPNSNVGGGTAPTNLTFPVVGFSLALQTGTPNPVALTAGTPAMFQVNVPITPTGAALPASVMIACTVPQALTGATCVPGTTTIAQGATTGSTTITLTAVPTMAQAAAPLGGGPGPLAIHLLWLAALVFAAMWGILMLTRQRTLQGGRAPVYLTLLLLALSAAALAGCTTAGSSATPTPTGPSMVTVTATTSDGATSSIQVPINVTN